MMFEERGVEKDSCDVDEKILEIIKRYIRNAKADWVLISGCDEEPLLEHLTNDFPNVHFIAVVREDNFIHVGKTLSNKKVMFWHADIKEIECPRLKADVVIALNFIECHSKALVAIRKLAGFSDGYLILSAPNLDRKKEVANMEEYHELCILDYLVELVELSGLKVVEVGCANNNEFIIVVAKREEEYDRPRGRFFMDDLWRFFYRRPR